MHLKPILQGFGILAVVLSLFPFVAADYWWIRMFDYPHVQLTILTLVSLLVYFFRFDLRNWRDYTFIGVLSACFLLQLTKIYPYTPFAEVQLLDNTETDTQRSLAILATNVLQDNEEYGKVINEVFIWEPDVLIFTETNQKWRDELRKGLRGFDYNYHMEMPLNNTYGMLVYSKFELLEPEIKFLFDDSIPSMHAKIVMPSQELVQMHVIHPRPPMPPHDGSSTGRDAEMMMVAKMAKESNIPVFVAGDFNDVAWSQSTRLFQSVSRLLDPRIGRGFYNTFDATSWLMRWPLDHLFVSEDFRLVKIQVGNDVGSDHFPFYTRLSLEPSKGSVQKMPAPQPQEIKDAEKQIENQQEKE